MLNKIKLSKFLARCSSLSSSSSLSSLGVKNNFIQITKTKTTLTNYSQSSLATSQSTPSLNLTNNETTTRKVDDCVIESRVWEPHYSRLSYTVSDTHGAHLIYETIGERLKVLAELNPNGKPYKFALTKTEFKFAELYQRVETLAQGLLNLGFKKGDNLAVLLPNIPETTLTILAAASIGVVVVLLNPAYQLVEIEYMLKKTKAKGIVMLDNLKTLQHYEILKKICPELESSRKGELHSANLPELKHVIVASLMPNTVRDEHKYKGTWSFNEIQNYARVTLDKPIVFPDDPFTMLFTSGTTGKPKAAVLSQFSLQNTVHFGSVFHGGFDSKRITCCPIPMFHVFGLVVGCLGPIVIGTNTTIFPNFFPETVSTMKAIQDYRTTAIDGAPVILFDILNHPDRKKYDLSSLELALMGASTVPKELLIKLKNELNIRHLIIAYGMTETASSGCITKINDVDLNEKHAYESVGRPFPYVECKVIDPKTQQIVPHDVDGELCMRGYGIMKGYYDEPEKTAETIDQHGWLKTGDLVSMDKHGYIFFKSRAKELVIRGGVNIYPAEIESFLLTHESIANAYAFGYPDERTGEELCAWIKLKPEAVKDVNAENIKEFCKGNIAYFKIPKYIKFVDSFPVNATGKVQKFKMQEQMLVDLQSIDSAKNLFRIN